MNSSIDNLAIVWASIEELCDGLTDSQWELPTGCPGWTVKDNLSHLVDYEALAIGRPASRHQPAPCAHVKNDLGRHNEIGVDARRQKPGREVLAEFREVTSERLAGLRRLTEQDLAAQTATPVGPGTVAELLTMRVMDTWSHEQDIRRAAGRPGHSAGPAAGEALGYLTRFLPYVVGKRVAAPEGSKIVFEIGDRSPVAVEMSGGRGRFAADPGGPAVRLAMPVTTFAALVGGRCDVPGDVRITGDSQLGRRVVQAMGFLP